MSARAIASGALLLLVAGSLLYWALRGDDAGAASPAATGDATRAAVVVTYFTTDVRCDSCRKIEALTRRAVEEGFPDALASGALVFRVVNTDREENEHYLDDYEIGNKVVIVSRQERGVEVEWTRRQDVWLLFDTPDEFLAYVQEPIRTYLERG